MPSTGLNSIRLSHCRRSICVVACLLLTASTGCSLFPDVRHQPQYINPFPQIKTVAVLPFFNQSEEPTLSGERVALAYMNELQAIRGFEVLPLGAVKTRLSEYTGPLTSGEHFQEFARHLGVDAVLIGSITDYSAYYPPRMSLAVKWYAANPGFHPVLPGYGLPWGTKQEKKIPKWIHYEAQRALAAEQLKSQTPAAPSPLPIMPEDRRLQGLSPLESIDDGLELNEPTSPTHDQGELDSLPLPPAVTTTSAKSVIVTNGWDDPNDSLPSEWPDPRGFIPDPPTATRPDYKPQVEPIIEHMRNFNGHDEEFTEQLADYFYFRDDARFGGWQAYLQRSEDFIRFCCYLHLTETLGSRGGQEKSRLIFRWPIDRYSR